MLRAYRTAFAVAAAVVALAGCNLSFQPVNLTAAEHPAAWEGNYGAGRVSPPAGR